METWRVVPSDLRYEVSDLGRIRRIGRSHGATVGRILKPRRGGDGRYLKVSFGRARQVFIHRIVAEAFLGPGEGRQVNHINGNPSDCRLTNLEWATASENITHSYAVLGRQAAPSRGEKQWNSKLTTPIVIEMRRLWDSGEANQAVIARRYRVRQSTVSRIVLRQSWAHVT